jgi:hypothetical protein
VIAPSKHIFGSDGFFFFSLSLVFFFFFFVPEFDEDDDVLISSFSEEAPDEKTFLEPRDIFSSFSYSRSSKQNERERKRKKDAIRTHARAREAIILRCCFWCRVASRLVNNTRAKSKR